MVNYAAPMVNQSKYKRVVIAPISKITCTHAGDDVLVILISLSKLDEAADSLYVGDSILTTVSKLCSILTEPKKMMRPSSTINSFLKKLTWREIQVIQLSMEIKCNKILSKTLGIKIKTIYSHRVSIIKKLGLRNRLELICFGLENKNEILEVYAIMASIRR